jgi:hypothetical protein
MRKAFDANVPKLKPRLKLGGGAAVVEEEGVAAPVAAPVALASEKPATSTTTSTSTSTTTTTTTAATAAPAVAASTARRARVEDEVEVEVEDQVQVQDHVQVQVPLGEMATDVLGRRERLEKIKRKVAEAAKPQVRIHPVPADPARAAESVLGLVRDLELELVRAREREEALRGDLEDARRELGRAATEGRTAVE